MRTVFLNILAILVCTTLCEAHADPVYIENFSYCPKEIGIPTDGTALVGWYATVQSMALNKFGFVKLVTPGGPESRSSLAANQRGREPGALFWKKPTTDLLLHTDERTFDVASVLSLSFDMRFTGRDSAGNLDVARLALLIDNQWFISSRIIQPSAEGQWQQGSMTLHDQTFGTSPVLKGGGTSLPVAFETLLPQSGTISGFGFYFSTIQGQVRFDNVTLSDAVNSVQPTPGDTSALSASPCSGDIPISNPLTDDLLGTGEQFVSVQLTATFCPNTKTPSKNHLKGTRGATTRFLKTLQEVSFENTRDSVILNLLLSKSLSFDQLSKLSVGDFDGQNIHVAVTGKKSKKVIALPPTLVATLNEYLIPSGLVDFPSAPLFQSLANSNKNPSSIGLCAAEIQKIATSRVKAARFGSLIKLIK